MEYLVSFRAFFAQKISNILVESFFAFFCLNETDHFAKAIAYQLLTIVQKTARINTKYSKNETFFKIGHLAKTLTHAKAVDFAKWSVWVKN